MSSRDPGRGQNKEISPDKTLMLHSLAVVLYQYGGLARVIFPTYELEGAVDSW
jgi:hypothetical protein